MGRLTTHVLDTSLGRPAAGLRLSLHRAAGAGWVLCREAITNDDGRVDAPLLEGASMTAGLYEIVFHAGPYLSAHRTEGAAPPFLDDIPVRFAIADGEAHYHVPLLLSPFGYSTYRGS